MIIFTLLIQLLISNYSFANQARDPLAEDLFNFAAPSSSDLGKKLSLWATFYNLPQLTDGSGDYPLRDKLGMDLGARLSHRGWCDSAMEGSVQVKYKSGEIKTFNYAGVTTEHTVNCKEYFKFDVSKTKFREAAGPYGDGLDEYILSPYRTLATDNTKIIPGTVLFVPKARGAIITLKSGRIITHDGYFFAGDKGGAIKGNHIDVFVGTHSNANYFPWIGSKESKVFDAYIVTDPKVISDLNWLHATNR